MRYLVSVMILGLVLVPRSHTTAQIDSFYQVRTIPLDFGDEIVGEIVDLAVDLDGYYYLADWNLHSIWVTDPEGKLVRKIGREGSGPGELLSPRSISLFQDQLVVHDQGNNRISTYSTDGEHLTSFRVEEHLVLGTVAGGDGNIAVKSAGDAGFFAVYDFHGIRIGDRGSGNTDYFMVSFDLRPDQHVSLTANGEILASNPKRYDVVRMDWDGTVLATYAADPPGYAEFEDPAETGFDEINLEGWTPLGRPLAIGEYVLVQWYSFRSDSQGGPVYYGDLFTMEGEPVQLANESPAGFLWAENNNLYAIDMTRIDEVNPNPELVIYRLREETYKK